MVGRPKYQITQPDFFIARRYIENGMLRGYIRSVDGYLVFQRASTPEALQTWCDDYLSDETFKKLKRAVIVARKRSRDYKTVRAKIKVDLDHHAHLRLSSLGKELNKNHSDTVLIMEEAYWKAKDAGLV